jgi:hypothetical protein
MTRISLVFLVGILLAGCSTGNTGQISLAQERTACADVGVAPGNLLSRQCVASLDQSLADEQTIDP